MTNEPTRSPLKNEPSGEIVDPPDALLSAEAETTLPKLDISIVVQPGRTWHGTQVVCLTGEETFPSFMEFSPMDEPCSGRLLDDRLCKNGHGTCVSAASLIRGGSPEVTIDGDGGRGVGGLVQVIESLINSAIAHE